jgi:hypothetical protein
VDRRTGLVFALILAVVAGLGAAAAILGSGPAPGRPDNLPTIDGIVTSVDSAGLGNVKGFRLRTADGRTLSFGLDLLRDGVQFPPGHLTEHLATSSPVRVWYQGSDDQLQAVWLADAASG